MNFQGYGIAYDLSSLWDRLDLTKVNKNTFRKTTLQLSLFPPLESTLKGKQDLSQGQDSSPDSALPIT